MKEPYYTIREASERVGVESHVLRYWEEELKMDIHRNQMGHRYYTEHDIRLLCMVRKLKDKGLQLKAIRSYIEKRQEQINSGKEQKDVQKTAGADVETAYGNVIEESDVREQDNNEPSHSVKYHEGRNRDGNSTEKRDLRKENHDRNDSTELVTVNTGSGIMTNEEKLEQFQRIMNKILSNAIQENNELIGRSAGEHAADAVVTRMQGMTKEQEERAEERYRKLDQTLREIQLARKEAAAANMRPVDKRRQQRLKRKNKQKDKDATQTVDDTVTTASEGSEEEGGVDLSVTASTDKA